MQLSCLRVRKWEEKGQKASWNWKRLCPFELEICDCVSHSLPKISVHLIDSILRLPSPIIAIITAISEELQFVGLTASFGCQLVWVADCLEPWKGTLIADSKGNFRENQDVEMQTEQGDLL